MTQTIQLQANERIDHLVREQLQIIQSKDYFSFSLDAVLLADFVTLPNRDHFKYLDFCSGTGVIPLLLSARTSAPLAGIEIQPELVDMARRSVKLNQLEDQIEFICGDLTTWQPKEASYDVITCNPPYFLVENSKSAHQLTSHAIARHELTLTLDQWVRKARSLLKQKGKLFIVYRPDRLDDLIEALLRHHFSLHRLQFIYPKPDKPANIVLVEAIYSGGRQGVKVIPPLYVHDEHNQYTKEVQAIYFGV